MECKLKRVGVHAAIGHPLFGDKTYGFQIASARLVPSGKYNQFVANNFEILPRQAFGRQDAVERFAVVPKSST